MRERAIDMLQWATSDNSDQLYKVNETINAKKTCFARSSCHNRTNILADVISVGSSRSTEYLRKQRETWASPATEMNVISLGNASCQDLDPSCAKSV
jgi:hypothetical protein